MTKDLTIETARQLGATVPDAPTGCLYSETADWCAHQACRDAAMDARCFALEQVAEKLGLNYGDEPSMALREVL